MKSGLGIVYPAAMLAILLIAGSAGTGPQQADRELDARIAGFLEKMRWSWRDMNVPERDGELLRDIVLENGYTRALEIGTSTGHSGIYIAWALAKTGGRLTTIDIDRGRYEEAVDNFETVGLDRIIDARLADAHKLVPELEGPFDFVFIDADKDWYVNYAKAVIPKLLPGGCIAAHNVYDPGPTGSGRRRGFRRGGDWGYFEFMSGLPEFETRVLPEGSRSLAVSFKKR